MTWAPRRSSSTVCSSRRRSAVTATVKACSSFPVTSGHPIGAFGRR